VILLFLAVEGPGEIETETGKIDRDRGNERNALVGRSEKHVELKLTGFTLLKNLFRVEGAQAVEEGAGIEESGVEEVGRKAAGLGLKFAKAKHAGLQCKFNKVVFESRHLGVADRIAEGLLRG
jgi:hypothetical protein